MKKNALIVCAFMAGLFASCSSEDIQEESVELFHASSLLLMRMRFQKSSSSMMP